MQKGKTQGIQVIARAATVLRALRDTGAGMSLGEIAAQVDLPRSTVQRIVAALANEGFVSIDRGSHGIRLGPEIQSLALVLADVRRDRLRPLMQKIAAETKETVDLAKLDGDEMLFVDQIIGSQRLRTASRVGDRFPLTTTANGKAALACLSEAEAARLVISEIELSKANGSNLTEILSEIDAIRKGALARDEDEHTEGISALGFAIRDASGDIFALSVPVPSSRYARVRDTLIDVLSRYRNDTSG